MSKKKKSKPIDSAVPDMEKDKIREQHILREVNEKVFCFQCIYAEEEFAGKKGNLDCHLNPPPFKRTIDSAWCGRGKKVW
jgi:hypothetical protein